MSVHTEELNSKHCAGRFSTELYSTFYRKKEVLLSTEEYRPKRAKLPHCHALLRGEPASSR